MKLEKISKKKQDGMKSAYFSQSILKNCTLIAVMILFSFVLIISGCGEVEEETNKENDNEETGNNKKITSMKEFNECLSEKGIVVYGMEWCPACNGLVENLGGYDSAEPVYVECTENEQKCESEMQGNAVPEVQLDGEKYEGQRSLEGFSDATGCELPN